MREAHRAIAALTTPGARASRLAAVQARTSARRRSDATVAEIIASMDVRGAWVTDGLVVPREPKPGVMEDETVAVRGISTATFAGHMSALIAFVQDAR